MEPALQRSLRVGEAAAGEHRVIDRRGRRVARDPQVVAGAPHRGDRDQAGPQFEAERFADPGHGRGENRLDHGAMLGRHQQSRPVAAEDEGGVGLGQGVAHPRDQGGPGDIHRPVAPLRDGPGRHHHVAQGDPPRVRHRDVAGVVEHVRELRQTRNRGVAEGGRRAGFLGIHRQTAGRGGSERDIGTGLVRRHRRASLLSRWGSTAQRCSPRRGDLCPGDCGPAMSSPSEPLRLRQKGCPSPCRLVPRGRRR